jgi:hypothetical protein
MFRKVFVDVNLTQTKDGKTIPRSIVFEDGTEYPVDRLRGVCRAAAERVGGCGLRYTIVVGGRETYLFEDGRQWFVEAKTRA